MTMIDEEQHKSKPFDPFFDEIRRIVREELSQAIAHISAERPEDRLLTANEAAPLLGYTKFWLYHHWKEFPFAKRIGRKGVRFSYQGLQKYIAGRLVDRDRGREAHGVWTNPEHSVLYVAHEQDELPGTPNAGQTVCTAFDVSDPMEPRSVAQIPLGELSLPSGKLRNKKSINLVYVRPGARSQTA